MPNPSAKPQGRQRLTKKGYEKRDANAKWILGILAFLLVSGLIMHLCIAGVLERLQKTPTPNDPWTGSRRIADTLAEGKAFPRLQVVPAEDLRKFREREEAELNTYGWINRTAGVVRIPVTRAMELVLQRKLPSRSGTNESGLGPTSYQLQQQRPQSPQPEIQGQQQ
jgi:hypothetical protein